MNIDQAEAQRLYEKQLKVLAQALAVIHPDDDMNARARELWEFVEGLQDKLHEDLTNLALERAKEFHEENGGNEVVVFEDENSV